MPQAQLKTSAYEQALLDQCPSAHQDGLTLLHWLRSAQATGFADAFPLTDMPDQNESALGFFDTVQMGDQQVEVLGNTQTMFFDRITPTDPKLDIERLCEQVRAFAITWFMRVSAPHLPHEKDAPSIKRDPAPLRDGFKFKQLFYQNRSGDIGAFDEPSQSKVDLNQLNQNLEWMVLKTNIFNFNLALNLIPGTDTVVQTPYDAQSYLVTSRHFLEESHNPTPELAGRYGFAYAFIQDPRMGFFNYGPGKFERAVQSFRFDVTHQGEIKVEMTFVSSKPDRFFNANPVKMGLDAVDTMSFGLTRPFSRLFRAIAPVDMMDFDPIVDPIKTANLFGAGIPARHFGISQRRLMIAMLFKHFQQHYQTMRGARLTWRQIPDWSDTAALPQWVIQGASP